MSQISVVKQKHGPTMKLTITVVIVLENTKPVDLTTGTIFVGEDDDALVNFTFRWHSNNNKHNLIHPYVGVIRNSGSRKHRDNNALTQKNQAPKSTEEIIVACDRFNQSFFSVDIWTESAMNSKKYDSIKTCDIGSREISSLMYIFNVDVTVKAECPKPSTLLINSQLHDDTEYTDFQLCANDEAVWFHKTVMSLHSEFFKTMLRGEWRRCTHVNVKGVTLQTLKDLKDYMYLGTLPEKGLDALLLIAVQFSMDKLKSDCISKLVKSVKPENFEQIVKFACQGSVLLDLVRTLIFEVPDDIRNNLRYTNCLRGSN